MSAWRIVCDAGGTNIRVARARGPFDISQVEVVPTLEAASLSNVLSSYLLRCGDGALCEGAYIAAAGPVENEAIKLTNAHLEIAAREVRNAIHKPVRLINDLEAVAWAVPHLAPDALEAVCDVAMPLAGPRLIVNVGTGFGAALLLDLAPGAHVVACEPGHMKLAAFLGGEAAAITAKWSIEDVISGSAFADRGKLAHLWGWDGPTGCAPADLFEGAEQSEAGRRFLRDVSAVFGQICGDLVLATGAWGGVYTCGSVASAWLRHADRERFAASFRDKGPMGSRIARTGVYHIAAPHPALIGLAIAPLA